MNNLPQPNHLLKRARLERGWSQQEVADLIEAPHAFMVNRWENGIVFPGPVYRKKLLHLFGKSLEELGLVKREKAALVAVELLTPYNPQALISDPAVPLHQSLSRKLIGRDALLEAIIQRLQGGHHRRIALQGLPGIGKTTLAAALIASPTLQERFPDGMLWAGLGPKLHLSAILSRWSTLLGISGAQTSELTNSDAWTHALRDAIGMRRVLIVIDDAWTIEDALACMVGGPLCAYVLTTRLPEVALHFAGEQVFPVPELGQDEGKEMLADYVPTLKETNEELLHALIQAVGGLPLAIKLMGTHLMLQARHHQPRRLLAALTRLQTARERLLLAEPQAGVERDTRLSPGTPLTLQAMIELSEMVLSEVERQALYALSVFPPKPHSFSEEAALAVTASSPEVLDRLVDTGLIEVGADDRYQLHQTIADYAQSRQTDSGAEERLVHYVKQYIEQYQLQNEHLDQESHLILTTLETAHKLPASGETYLQSIIASVPYLRTSKPLNVVEQILRQAYQLARTGSFHAQLLSIAGQMGEIVREQGNYAEAEAILREGLALVAYSDTKESIDLLAVLGTVLAEQSDYAQAWFYMDEAIERAERIGYQERLGAFYSNRGLLGIFEGELAGAERDLLKGYALRHHNMKPRHLTVILENLGDIYIHKGNFPLSQHYLQEGYKMAQTFKYHDLLGTIQYSFARIAYFQGEYARAKILYEEGIEQARRGLLHRRLFLLLCGISLVAMKMGDFELAQDYQQEASALIQPKGWLDKRCSLLLARGLTALEQQEPGQARSFFQEVLASARQSHRLEYCCESLIHLGITLQQAGESQEAQHYLEEGLTLAHKLTMPRLVGEALLAWGEHYLLQQEYRQASEQYEELMRTIPQEYQELIARAHAGLAFVAAAQQQYEEARSQGQIALTLFEQMGHFKHKQMQRWLEALPQPT